MVKITNIRKSIKFYLFTFGAMTATGLRLLEFYNSCVFLEEYKLVIFTVCNQFTDTTF